MDKRFGSFLVWSLAIWLVYFGVLALFQKPEEGKLQKGQQDVAGELADNTDATAEAKVAEAVADDDSVLEATPDADTGDASPADEAQPEIAAADNAPPSAAPERRVTLGGLGPDSDANMLVTFNSRGAAVERIELNNPRYKELEDQSGYLGHLGLSNVPEGGCRVTVVGPGTPAAQAKTADGNVGLRGPQFASDDNGSAVEQAPGDRIVAIDGEPIGTAGDLQRLMKETQPGQEITLRVERTDSGGASVTLEFSTTLGRRPLELARPEPQFVPEDAVDASQPLSFLLGISQIGDRVAGFGQAEIQELPSLRETPWSVAELPRAGELGPGVEFRKALTAAELDKVGQVGSWEIVKRFRLSPRAASDPDAKDSAGMARRDHHLMLEIELRNTGTQAGSIAYQLQGPTGLPLEGWWYSSKVHPTRFSAAGARDVVWRAQGDAHRLITCPKITDRAMEEEEEPETVLAATEEEGTLNYVGCDSQYFAVVLQRPSTDADDPATAPLNYVLQNVVALPVGPLDEQRKKRTEVTFRVGSRELQVPPGESITQRFTIFAGPKDPDVLAAYGLDDCIVYGWFGKISRPMVKLLHFFYRATGSFSYGIAIIMLTVLVRGAMFPLGRKMALNSQKMQELAPEMKAIADKYKNDLEKRTKAQQELYAKHGFNPLSGCMMMFVQIPIFVSLYRGLSVDVALRQAPLIPGMRWCSNLAGPDMFWHWESFVPGFLSDRTGWLGPYLNVLPLITVVLFLVQQQLFTPPPTDENQKTQQQIMKVMMLFMGVMFHKVAAGLCIYFIASSIWGLGERLLLPKSKSKTTTPGGSSPSSGGGSSGGGRGGNGPGSNGSAAANRRKRRKNK